MVEQNRNAQLRTLLLNECMAQPEQLVPVLHYDGTPITARYIRAEIQKHFAVAKVTPLHLRQKA